MEDHCIFCGDVIPEGTMACVNCEKRLNDEYTMKEVNKKMINWRVRIANKNFWLALIPAVLLLIQVVLSVFNVEMDFGELGNKLIAVVNAVFAVLAILGIVNDPTTDGLKDSARAMTYYLPYKDWPDDDD